LQNVKPLSRPGLWDLFITWLGLGIQSFGGGSATFYLVRQTSLARGWLDDDEFTRAWALAQVSPGINLMKLTILIGKRLRGWPGLIVSVGGLILPSALVTVLMTAGFSAIRGQPLIQAAMRGIFPATIGLSLAMAVQMGWPLLARARKEGRARLAAHVLVLAGSALMLAGGYGSPVVVLLLSGAATLLTLAVVPAGRELPVEKEAG